MQKGWLHNRRLAMKVVRRLVWRRASLGIPSLLLALGEWGVFRALSGPRGHEGSPFRPTLLV